MSPNSELNSLSFLFRHTDLDDEEQRQRELEKGDAKLDIEKNDLLSSTLPNAKGTSGVSPVSQTKDKTAVTASALRSERSETPRTGNQGAGSNPAVLNHSPRRHDPCFDRPNET